MEVGAGARRGAAFDGAAYEAERLRLDAEARESMAEASELEGSGDPKAWKWAIRKRVWDSMEARNVAQNPWPVHHRIPNFVGASAATSELSELEIFQVAECVKVNPDSPQNQVRFLTLSDGKKLLMPQPCLRTGFFSVLQSSMLAPHSVNEACTSAGLPIDPKTGAELGKGEGQVWLLQKVLNQTGAELGKGTSMVASKGSESVSVKCVLTKIAGCKDLVASKGFAEPEYGMLQYMGAIDDSTPVVTSVEKFLIHDVPVDVICTPTQVIFTNTSIPKPQGIYWDKLSPEKLGQIRILRELERKIEQETGRQLPSTTDMVVLPPLSSACVAGVKTAAAMAAMQTEIEIETWVVTVE
ncbi:hypothetical protein ACJRO7_007886 [Eucalyptus globulus]|uniref:Uncharacterized protein n=1 Tax=Eucalyptus globulus TaxID=34317 RepID=A0ABD3IPX5_EUCGL